MKLQNNIVSMALGGLITLALVFGAYATFAQTGDDAVGTPDSPGAETETGDLRTPFPFFSQWEQRGFDRIGPRAALADIDEAELLAEALGISVAELQAAQEAVRTAMIAQAVTDGQITQEQADQLLAAPGGMMASRGICGFGPHGVDRAALLAAELGISEEALQDALDQVQAARLKAIVEAGVLTQEQADLIAAYQAVQGFVDYDGLTTSVQSFFQDAIEKALADGVITQAQADLMLGNLSHLTMRGFPGGRMPGMGGRGGHGGFGGHGHGLCRIP